MAKRQLHDGKTGRPRKHGDPITGEGRSGIAISLRLDPELREKINAYCEAFFKEHRIKITMTDVIEKSLRSLFEKGEGAETKKAGE